MAFLDTAPLIGSSFDSLAGQNQYWASLNNRTQSENIARANQAEQSRNNYLQQVAGLARQDQNVQDIGSERAAERAASLLASHAAQLESKRQFDVSAQLEREKMKATNEAKTAAEDEAKNMLDKSAEALAPDLQDYHSKLADATDQFTAEQRTLTTAAQSKLAALPDTEKKNVSIDRNGYLIPNMRGMTLGPAASKANEELATNRADFNAAKESLATATRAYQEAHKSVLGSKLQVIMHKDEDGNPYPTIRNPFTDKYFGVKKGGKTKEVPVASEPDLSGDYSSFLQNFRAPDTVQPIGAMPAVSPNFNFAGAAPDSASPVRQVVRGPNGRLVYAPAQ